MRPTAASEAADGGGAAGVAAAAEACADPSPARLAHHRDSI